MADPSPLYRKAPKGRNSKNHHHGRPILLHKLHFNGTCCFPAAVSNWMLNWMHCNNNKVASVRQHGCVTVLKIHATDVTVVSYSSSTHFVGNTTLGGCCTLLGTVLVTPSRCAPRGHVSCCMTYSGSVGIAGECSVDVFGDISK